MSLLSPFSVVRIVLVNTSHPGNIGAAARAIKTMGFSQLYLVNPKHFPDPRATERAAHANDILMNARVVEKFTDAIADCHLVLGTSGRVRDVPWSLLTAENAAQKVATEVTEEKTIALVFGNEKNGLTNDELRHCHYQIEIPANPDYSSLNIAAAVQVVCYEMRKALLSSKQKNNEISETLATVTELEHFYGHLEQVLFKVDFLTTKRSGKIMQRLRRLFNRSRLDSRETSILRGILKAIEKKLR